MVRPIILTSVYPLKQIDNTKIDDIILKPINLKELIMIIKKWIIN